MPIIRFVRDKNRERGAFELEGFWRMRNQVWIRLVLSACFITCCSVPMSADAQGLAAGGGNQSRYGQQRGYFGIMGQVARPAVYELPSRFPSLVELVQSAGGLTNQASGSMRIIRKGHFGLRTFYSPDIQSNLLPGDLVVVDTNTSPGAQGFGSLTDKRLPPSEVQLALVNLIGRPVVLKMQSRDATLASIVERLGQRPEVAGTVRVVRTQRLRNRMESIQGSGGVLSSKTVLIFNPSVIDFDRIPLLPSPYRIGTFDGKLRHRLPASEPITLEPTRPIATRMPRQYTEPGKVHISAPNATAPVSETSDGKVKRSVSDNETISQQPKENNKSTAERVDDAPRPPDEGLATSEQNEAIESSRSNQGRNLVPSVKELGGQNNVEPDVSVQENPDGDQSKPPAAARQEITASPTIAISESKPSGSVVRPKNDATLAAESTPSRLRQVHHWRYQEPLLKWPVISIAVVVIAAITLASIMLWPIVGYDTSTEGNRIKRSNRYYLDAIINNRFPLTEESLNLPNTLQFYGRPAEQKSYRLQAKHEIPRSPHYLKRKPHTDVAEPSGNPVSKSPPSKEAGVLDRALSTVRGDVQQ